MLKFTNLTTNHKAMTVFNHYEKKLARKYTRRDKKKSAKMKVSGKSALKLRHIIQKKAANVPC